MPIIEVWGAPEDVEEESLNQLCDRIISAVMGVEELGLNNPSQISIFFPADRMMKDLGAEVIAYVKGLFEKPERTDEVRNKLAKAVGELLHQVFSDAFVECFIESFNPQQGFWSSETIS